MPFRIDVLGPRRKDHAGYFLWDLANTLFWPLAFTVGLRMKRQRAPANGHRPHRTALRRLGQIAQAGERQAGLRAWIRALFLFRDISGNLRSALFKFGSGNAQSLLKRAARGIDQRRLFGIE
jgi:hypothetical protein